MRYGGIAYEEAAQYGLSINQSGGLYNNGASFSIEKKLEVAVTYKKHVHNNDSTITLISMTKLTNPPLTTGVLGYIIPVWMDGCTWTLNLGYSQ